MLIRTAFTLLTIFCFSINVSDARILHCDVELVLDYHYLPEGEEPTENRIARDIIDGEKASTAFFREFIPLKTVGSNRNANRARKDAKDRFHMCTNLWQDGYQGESGAPGVFRITQDSKGVGGYATTQVCGKSGYTDNPADKHFADYIDEVNQSVGHVDVGYLGHYVATRLCNNPGWWSQDVPADNPDADHNVFVTVSRKTFGDTGCSHAQTITKDMGNYKAFCRNYDGIHAGNDVDEDGVPDHADPVDGPNSGWSDCAEGPAGRCYACPLGQEFNKTTGLCNGPNIEVNVKRLGEALGAVCGNFEGPMGEYRMQNCPINRNAEQYIQISSLPVVRDPDGHWWDWINIFSDEGLFKSAAQCLGLTDEEDADGLPVLGLVDCFEQVGGYVEGSGGLAWDGFASHHVARWNGHDEDTLPEIHWSNDVPKPPNTDSLWSEDALYLGPDIDNFALAQLNNARTTYTEEELNIDDFYVSDKNKIRNILETDLGNKLFIVDLGASVGSASDDDNDAVRAQLFSENCTPAMFSEDSQALDAVDLLDDVLKLTETKDEFRTEQPDGDGNPTLGDTRYVNKIKDAIKDCAPVTISSRHLRIITPIIHYELPGVASGAQPASHYFLLNRCASRPNAKAFFHPRFTVNEIEENIEHFIEYDCMLTQEALNANALSYESGSTIAIENIEQMADNIFKFVAPMVFMQDWGIITWLGEAAEGDGFLSGMYQLFEIGETASKIGFFTMNIDMLVSSVRGLNNCGRQEHWCQAENIGMILLSALFIKGDLSAMSEEFNINRSIPDAIGDIVEAENGKPGLHNDINLSNNIQDTIDKTDELHNEAKDAQNAKAERVEDERREACEGDPGTHLR